MVTVSENKEAFVTDDSVEDSLREERKRTGRYVAAVIAIFVSLFGLYQAMARGTPEYAAFFLPALIMFLYVLWILYASRSRGGKSAEETLDNSKDVEESIPNVVVKNIVNVEPSTSQSNYNIHRSYSIA